MRGVMSAQGGNRVSSAEGRSDPAAVAPGMGEQVAHQMHAAALPGGMEYFGDRGLQSLVGIGDHQLHAAQPTASKLAQEFGPEGLGFRGTDVHAENLTPASAVDADRDDHGD